jgi:opacity protein-like surface antigen
MASPRYTLRRVGATATTTQTINLANQLRPFFVGGAGVGAPSYLHPQPVAATSWTVNHGLGYRPAITALSVGGVEMFAAVVHTSVNQAVITFDQPTAGQAICS